MLSIHDDGDDNEDGVRSIKNEDSRRDIPLHPALVAEGFLVHVHALPNGSPLFPDIRPDAVFGRRGTTAQKKVSRWLRQTLGIKDTRVAPNHSWRHWFVTACRKAQLQIEVRSALTGHSAKLDESAGYGAAMGTLIDVLAAAIAQVSCPCPPVATNTVQDDRPA